MATNRPVQPGMTRLGQAASAESGAAEASSFGLPAVVSPPALTADQMREIDRVMVEDLHVELVQMMENAGRSLA